MNALASRSLIVAAAVIAVAGGAGCGTSHERDGGAEPSTVVVKKRDATLVDQIVEAAVAEARGPGAHAALRPRARIEYPAINECSGIDSYDGQFVVHNDSGDRPRIFCSTTLDFANPDEYLVPGAKAVDWEEITVYRGDLLVCDIGDNARRRSSVQLYRVRLENVGGGRAARLVATYPYAYPDGPHDAEAAFTIADVLYVVTKDRGDGTLVYRFDNLESAEELGEGRVNEPVQVGVLELDSHEQVTAGTYDSVSGTVALLTYSAIVTYPASRLSGPPKRVHRFWGRQAESICVVDRDLVVTNEQRDVFVINGLLDGFDDSPLLPEHRTLRLPLVTHANDLTGTPVPLREADPAESLRLAIDGEWVFLDARLRIGADFAPVRVEPPSVGSCLLVMFTENEHHHVDARDAQFALSTDADGVVGVWRVDLGSETLGVTPVVNARVDGERRATSLSVSVRLPLSDVFPGGVVPDTFRFDARGIDLREGEQPHFSGDDLFAIYRPYVWGRVNVVR